MVLLLFVNSSHTILENVKRININNCELFIEFHYNHKYRTIEEIDSILSQVGINIGNYHFKGLDCYQYGKLHFNEDGDTDILCVIPENLRDILEISVFG